MKSPVTTHVLDTAKGRPAAGVAVSLKRFNGPNAELIAEGQTDEDGRIMNWFSSDVFSAGHYQISFDLKQYFAGEKSFFPGATIDFMVENLNEHYHVPLLLSPYGYSTYRGS